MNDETSDAIGAEFKELAKITPDTPVAPAHVVASIALSMAMKYHDINTVQEGALYQQYKLEGKNMTPLHLDHVLDTATRIEMWLLGASDRIAKIVVDAVAFAVDDEAGADDAGLPEEQSDEAPHV